MPIGYIALMPKDLGNIGIGEPKCSFPYMGVSLKFEFSFSIIYSLNLFSDVKWSIN